MKGGRFFLTSNLGLRAVSGYAETTKAAFVVSSKVKKTSVGRHLIKRRLSAAVENLWAEIRNGLALIFTCNKDISGKTLAEIKSEVKELLQKAGALN